MPATPQTIWQVPAYLPYLQPPLTDEIVDAAQKTIGHPLPKEYVDLLRQQNGGYIRYRLENRLNEEIAGIGPNFPSLTKVQWDDAQECVSFPLQGLFPFDGNGDWNLCPDYRKDANPCNRCWIRRALPTPPTASGTAATRYSRFGDALATVGSRAARGIAAWA